MGCWSRYVVGGVPGVAGAGGLWLWSSLLWLGGGWRGLVEEEGGVVVVSEDDCCDHVFDLGSGFSLLLLLPIVLGVRWCSLPVGCVWLFFLGERIVGIIVVTRVSIISVIINFGFVWVDR